MAKVVKPSGKAVWNVRKPTYHGSEPQHRLNRLAAQEQRYAEKPGHSQGTGRPRGARP